MDGAETLMKRKKNRYNKQRAFYSGKKRRCTLET